jgi:hypothetical protein
LTIEQANQTFSHRRQAILQTGETPTA